MTRFTILFTIFTIVTVLASSQASPDGLFSKIKNSLGFNSVDVLDDITKAWDAPKCREKALEACKDISQNKDSSARIQKRSSGKSTVEILEEMTKAIESSKYKEKYPHNVCLKEYYVKHGCDLKYLKL